MKITLCGSILFYDEMLKIKEKLESMNHEVRLPPMQVKNHNDELMPVEEYYKIRKSGKDEAWVWDRKEEAMRNHFNKVEWSDAVLVINNEKNNIKGYVGGNTLMEMGLAFHLGKKIFLLNQIPDMSYKEEVLGMKPFIINGDLTKI